MLAVTNRRPRVTGVAALVAINAVLVVVAALGPSAAVGAALFGLVAPAAVAVVRRPQLGVLALVALVPFNGLLNIIPHPAIVNGWKETLVLLVLAATFVCPHEARRRGPRPALPWLPAFAGLVAVAIIAAVGLGDIVRAALGMKITFFYVLVAWALIRCPFDARERDLLATILMVTGVAAAAFGVAQQLLGADRLHALGFEYNSTIMFAGGFLRSFSTFVQPFGFGFYTMAVLLICTPVALADTTRRRNQLFLWAIPLLGLGMATSVVRGAVLGTGIGIAYLGARRHRILLLAFPLALVVLLTLPSDVSSVALSTASSQQRTAGWRQNMKVLTSHPIGAGPGTSAAAAEKLAKTKGSAYQPDNYYYHLAYEDGVLGVWFFALVLASAFLTTAHTPPDDPDAGLRRGAAAFFLAAAGASMVSSFFEIFPMDVLTWVLIATAATRLTPTQQAVAADVGPAAA